MKSQQLLRLLKLLETLDRGLRKRQGNWKKEFFQVCVQLVWQQQLQRESQNLS
jgi:hypothetical protein